jgi:amidohydrolase
MMGAEYVLKATELIKNECPNDIPCVLSFGKFEALGSTNVIPSSAEIKGTFRTMNEEWRLEAHFLLQNLANEISEKYKGKINLKVSKGYPFLKNDEVLTADLKKVFQDNLGTDFVHDLPIRMTAEDFAFYSQTIPVCFFRLGVGNTKEGITYGVHHPKFNIDSNALKTGIHAMVLAALQ